jgi:hypothetical protein
MLNLTRAKREAEAMIDDTLGRQQIKSKVRHPQPARVEKKAPDLGSKVAFGLTKG